jgi:hypothetical protein
MEIGSDIRWCGRAYVLEGVDPMNVPERRAYLRDPLADEVVEAPFDEIEPIAGASDDVSRPGP